MSAEQHRAEGFDRFGKGSVRQQLLLLQGAGDENRVCSPLNVYMALAMLAAVTDGQTQGQILDALGEDSLDELQTRAALLWQENSWNDGLVTSTLANSIWLQDGYEYNEDTLKKLGEEFFASAFSVPNW